MVTDEFKVYHFEDQIVAKPEDKHYIEDEVKKVFKVKVHERKLSLVDNHPF